MRFLTKFAIAVLVFMAFASVWQPKISVFSHTRSKSHSLSSMPSPESFMGESWTQTVVVPFTQNEDASFFVQQNPDLDIRLYAVDRHEGPLHGPKNKGHEATVYLTHIINNYDDLSDIHIFMHAHRFAHHNNEFHGFDALRMIRGLNRSHVIQQGFFNLRCSWSPGCPEWLRRKARQPALARQEEIALSSALQDLFSSISLPDALGQPCCSQFAVSKSTILKIPKARYVFFRDWLLQTPLNDFYSGRLWEYLWQYVFLEKPVHCPQESECYCRGYGLCWIDNTTLTEVHRLKVQKQSLQDRIAILETSYAVSPNAILEAQIASNKTLVRHVENQIDGIMKAKDA